MPRLRLITALALAAALSACVPPSQTKPSARKSTPAAGKAAAAPSPTPAQPEPTAADSTGKIAVFLITHPDGNPATLANLIAAEPRLHLTLIFPPGYLDGDTRQAAAARFRTLVSSKQVEAALSLDNEPILPLIENVNNAGPAVEKWGFEFSWPDDVAAQVARGSGAYQARWGALPSGFYPPFGAANQHVIEILRRFRLSWVLLQPSDVWGVKYFGGTAVIVPQIVGAGDESLTPAQAAEETAKAALARPYIAIDAGAWPTPDYEVQFIKALAKAAKTREFETGTAFSERLRKEYAFPDGADPFAREYTEWVRSPQQKRAWQLLADARQVVENYKNSGRANLTRLDAAIEEMCVAESGQFLLSLGLPGTGTPVAQRNFLATVANIYRLAGVPLPENLNTWFAERAVRRASVAATNVDNDRPFFVAGNQSLTWNDPKGDDHGPGMYVYPAGVGPKGLFDLRGLTIAWTDAEVTISAETAEAAPENAGVVPAVDVYIDVNRIPEAGTLPIIRQRGKAVVSRDAAWEYAVTLTPRVAALYQGQPGGERLLSVQASARNGNRMSVTFPRTALRGEPNRWRISAGLGAAEATPRNDAPNFLDVTAAATPKSFGGASGEAPTRYMDILAPTKVYEAGWFDLPFVEAE